MIRKAIVKDVPQICKLINHFAKQELMLPRSLNDVYENLRDYWVLEKAGAVYGCCGLHISWEDLAEVKSLAVDELRQHEGIGSKFIKICIDEAKKLGVKKVFTLTYVPEFFMKFGFKKLSKGKLPHKIWNECIKCSKYSNCAEIALILRLR